MDMIIHSDLIKGIIGKIINSVIKKKTNTNITVTLNNFDIKRLDNGNTKVHIDINGYLTDDDIKELYFLFKDNN